MVTARRDRAGVWQAGAVVAGSVLILWAALNQPYNQNELVQIAPYGEDSIAEVTGGTRQPPLGPLLGAILQQTFGVGQLQQRLVPVLSGIGTLVLVALLLRRLRTGTAGAFALWVLATAPLMVRYSAYTRPYALPLALMLLFVYSGHRWIDEGRRRWLLVTAAAAVALPLARVPEPSAFLAATAVTLAVLSLRGRFTWSRTSPLIAIALGSLMFVGYPLVRALASEASGMLDLDPSGVVDRFDTGLAELLTVSLPLMASWLPWWPVTVLAVALAAALPQSRRLLREWWWFWPLLAAPVGFVLAFHFLNPFSFEVLPYRSRSAYFFVVPYAFVLCALLAALAAARLSGWLRAGALALPVVVLLGQLPATATVVLHNDAPDYAAAAEVVANVPAGAVVLHTRPASPRGPRMGFLAESRYLGGDAGTVIEVGEVARRPRRIPGGAPVYLLVNGQCAVPGPCGPSSSSTWAEPIPGWRVSARFDRFTLYAPTPKHIGRWPAAEALASLGRSLGPRLGYMETFTAAALLKLHDRAQAGRSLVREMYAAASPETAELIRSVARRTELNPFVQ